MTHAPTPAEIHALARRINTLALAGYVAELPDAAIDQIYTAAPGQPGRGLQVFQDALHDDVKAITTASGAWRFGALTNADFRRAFDRRNADLDAYGRAA